MHLLIHRNTIMIHDLVFLLPQLRRERIAERIRALQELVPGVNKVRILSL